MSARDLLEWVWSRGLALVRSDRAAREAAPRSAESPLIVIPIPPWRTYFAFCAITLCFFALIGRACW